MVDSHFGDETNPLSILAKKYKKSPTQVAINWVVHNKNTMALIKATNGTHVNENVGSIGWEMDNSDYETITNLV